MSTLIDIVEARSRVFARLSNCPVCGSAMATAEKGDTIETVEFVCDSAFFLERGGVASVSRICPAPTHVAVRHLESVVARLLEGKAQAERYADIPTDVVMAAVKAVLS